MALVCAAQIAYGALVFLNIGTSTETVGRALLNHNRLLVAVNNLNVANILSAIPKVEVTVTGGTLCRSDGGFVARLASDTIRKIKVDCAVIGCPALDADGDLLDFDVHDVTVSQTIMAQARRNILVAGRSKVQRTAPARIVSLAALNMFATDKPIAPASATQRADWQTAVISGAWVGFSALPY